MNYSNILKKCVNELDAPQPRLDYLKGMLEVLLEMSDKPTIYETTSPEIREVVTRTPSDEHTEEIPAFLRAR